MRLNTLLIGAMLLGVKQVEASGLIAPETDNHDLMEFIRGGDWTDERINIALEMIENAGDVNAVSENGQTLLHRFVAGPFDSEVFFALISKGVQINAQDKNGWTPLLVAANYAKVDSVEALISIGANVDIASTNGLTPLMAAAKVYLRERLNDYLEIVKTLLKAGADVNAKQRYGLQTALSHASDPAIIDALKAAQTKALFEVKTIRQLEEMIASGVDLNIRYHGHGLLQWILKGDWTADKKAIALRLIKNVADVNAADEAGDIPLNTLSWGTFDRDVFDALIVKGANVNGQDESGWTPLIAAAYRANAKTVDALIIWEADVNTPNFGGMTPLMAAAKAEMGLSKSPEYLKIVKDLVGAGANVSARDLVRGNTALDYAQNVDIIHVLQGAQSGL